MGLLHLRCSRHRLVGVVVPGRNLPEEHGLVNKAELEHIRGIDEAGNVNAPKIETKTSVPWATLLRSPNMWAIMCAYFTYVYCLWIFLSWLPSYLVEFRHFTLLKVGFLASLPLWAGVVGDTVGGLATDWLLKRPATRSLPGEQWPSPACWAAWCSLCRLR
jgi:sugar phosphate permease